MRANTILIASGNAHKLQEFREIFGLFEAADVEIRTPRDLGLNWDPEETADSYVGNARIKARAFHSMVQGERDIWVLADDSGLEVDALGGRPGLRSARYHQAAANRDGCAALLHEMEGVPDDRRGARFRAVIVLLAPDGTEHVFEGACEGAIGFERRGKGGFGFDPVFRVAGDARCLAELSPTEKHRISHRGVATQKAIAFLTGQELPDSFPAQTDSLQ